MHRLLKESKRGNSYFVAGGNLHLHLATIHDLRPYSYYQTGYELGYLLKKELDYGRSRSVSLSLKQPFSLGLDPQETESYKVKAKAPVPSIHLGWGLDF